MNLLAMIIFFFLTFHDPITNPTNIQFDIPKSSYYFTAIALTRVANDDVPEGICRYFISVDSKKQFVPVDQIIEPPVPVNNNDINRFTFLPFTRTQILMQNAAAGSRPVEIYFDIKQNLINNLLLDINIE